jgi:hypothetical protein
MQQADNMSMLSFREASILKINVQTSEVVPAIKHYVIKAYGVVEV